jgi:predicted GNAT family N-acyltransferase
MIRVEIKRGLSQNLLDEIAKLRQKTWQKTGYSFHRPLGDAHEMCHDEVDQQANTDHVLVFNDNQLVAAGRVSYHTNVKEIKDVKYYTRFLNERWQYAQLGRLVVDPDFWGTGLSKIVDETRIKLARQNNAEILLVCAVGDKRRQALQKRGFEIIAIYNDDDDIVGQKDLKFYGMFRPAREDALTAFPNQMPESEHLAQAHSAF